MSSSAAAVPQPRVAGAGADADAGASALARFAPIALLTLLALVLRIPHLSRSLFTDEAFSLALAQRGFGHMLSLFGWEANGTTYPLALWPLIRVAGTDETVLRLPAVIAGTASVPALWWAARRFTTPGGALAAAGLLAVSPMAVWYSGTARSYAFVVLGACLAFGALARAVAQPAGTGAWAGYVAAMAFVAYSNLLSAPIALPAQALLAWRAEDRAARRRWLWSLLALALACIPLAVMSAISRGRRNALYWLPEAHLQTIKLALLEFTAGLSELGWVRALTLLAGVVLVAAAVVAARRGRGAGAAAPRDGLAVAAWWGVAPPAILILVSQVERVFWPRYAIVALPGLCLLVAVAAARLWHERRGRVLAAVCVGAIALASLAADHRQTSTLQEDWPPIAAWLRAGAGGTGRATTVVDSALVLPSLGYYDRAYRAPDGDLVVQEWHDRPLPAGFLGYKDPGGYGDVPVAPPPAAAFAASLRRRGGVGWIVASEADRSAGRDPRRDGAAAWARAHCRTQVRTAVGVWAMRVSDCTR